MLSKHVDADANSDSNSDISDVPVTADVSGIARSFLSYWPIDRAKITKFENGETLETDQNGRFGPFQWPVGKDITLILEKEGYQTTQTATVTVPPEGLNSPLSEMTFQVPSTWAFTFFKYAMGVTQDEEACQVTATVTQPEKTMEDIPQGEPGAKVTLSDGEKVQKHYFGIFERWPLTGKTNPFERGLTETSHDGGIALINVPPRAEPYTLTAEKEGVCFSKVKFIARKGVFINLSPPQGPSVIHYNEEKKESPKCRV